MASQDNYSHDSFGSPGGENPSESFEAQLNRLYGQEAAYTDDGSEYAPEDYGDEGYEPEDYPEEAYEPEDYNPELYAESEEGADYAGEPEAPARPPRERPRKSPPPRRKKAGPLTIIGRTLGIFFSTLLMFVLLVVGAILVVAHGPSEQACKMFVFSTNETSALKFVPYLFMDDETVDGILHPEPEVKEPDTFVEIGFETESGEAGEEAPLVQVDTENRSDELELIDIKESTFKGKMLIIHDPSRVVIGSLDYFGDLGLYLTDFMEKYDAIAGTNAGGFHDPDGQGDGGIPDGLVIRDGQIAFGSGGAYYVDVIGFDAEHILHVGNMSGQQALDLGIVNAVSFSQGPVLIQDGERQSWVNVSVNPRTCIGQRADGAVLLAVIEGRHLDSMGASFDDLADLMEKYGAVNAANLDGGSSSAMIYDGEQITKGSNIIGSRRMATAILVRK